jgi:hypothetical protein
VAADPRTVQREPAPPGTVRFAWRGQTITRPLPIDEEQAAVFARWLAVLRATGLPYALGGAYVTYAFTGAWRDTKDLDVFVEPRHVRPLLDALRTAGFATEVRDPLWLAKAHSGRHLLDILFAVRHARRLQVSDAWFETCLPATFLGVPTRLLGPEEVIATKVYVDARDRFDGGDIAHLIRAVQGDIDWRRVIALTGGDDEIVLWQLLFFHFVYPELAGYLPADLMRQAFRRTMAGAARDEAPPFRGMLVDPVLFAVDHDLWGHEDCRDRRPIVDARGTLL